MKQQINLIKNLKKRQSLERLFFFVNYIGIDKKLTISEKKSFFIFFNNYNYNNMFFVGSIILLKKDKIMLISKSDKISIKFDLSSPIIYNIYKLV